MTDQPQEERSLRTTRAGFRDFDTALLYMRQRFNAEYRISEGVQIIMEQEPGGTWSVVLSGARFVDDDS